VTLDMQREADDSLNSRRRNVLPHAKICERRRVKVRERESFNSQPKLSRKHNQNGIPF
jgi:hypothetical protein